MKDTIASKRGKMTLDNLKNTSKEEQFNGYFSFLIFLVGDIYVFGLLFHMLISL